MRIAVLIKQIPAFTEMALGADGRLRRDGVPLEMNPYCRRAVSKGVELARELAGSCTVFTLGPESAQDVLREAVAWGADRAVHISDPAFAGSDTLATSRALSAALTAESRFDLVLVGKNSVDADTGQVGPQVAQLLDLPFAGPARRLHIRHGRALLECETDDGRAELVVTLPAVLSVAERLCEPCKVDPQRRAQVPADRLTRLNAADLGDGPWGEKGSPTVIGQTRWQAVERDPVVLTGPLDRQVRQAVELLRHKGLGSSSRTAPAAVVPVTEDRPAGPIVAVLAEPGRGAMTAQLLGAAAELAEQLGGQTTVVGSDLDDHDMLSRAGADAAVEVVAESGALVAEDVAAALTCWARESAPWAVLVPSTAWGREVAARTAAALDAGLTADAIALELADRRLVGWKPAFGGQLAVAITATSPLQMATVRPGVLPTRTGRRPRSLTVERRHVVPRGRVRVLAAVTEDDVAALGSAPVVIGVGAGVDPADYPLFDPLLRLLGGVLAATRRVTDAGHLPRARQIGITGASVSPDLYIAVGTSGKFNHTIGFRAAKLVLAINPDPQAPVFAVADVGIVGEYQDVIGILRANLCLQAGEESDRL